MSPAFIWGAHAPSRAGERASRSRTSSRTDFKIIVFAASFVIRHSTFVIHCTFCSFPEHYQWNTCE